RRTGDQPDRAALAVRRGDERVAEAILRLGQAPVAQSGQAPPRDSLTAGHPFRPAGPIAPAATHPESVAPATLLPHGSAACFIESIHSEATDGIVCAARVPDAHGLTVGEEAPALVAIEMAAQTAGVFEARRRARTAGGMEPGIATEAGP